MTSTPGLPSYTPAQEPVQVGLDASVKAGVQGASGPEAREAPQCSPSLVIHSVINYCA
jgi:hypothetical protein